ncbi:MAG: FkbM family methyltransferase [Bacteroidales bacterium]|nr:FkbM family methyltransferase [Bacteroidales bacterium]
MLRWRRRRFEHLGDFRFSRPASSEIDRKLQKYFNYDGGYFIEAGANDGFLQSNTYYFEKARAWQGTLVEPVPHLYRQCLAERKRSKVFNRALVGRDFTETEIRIHYYNSMSFVDGAFSDRQAEEDHRNAALDCSHYKKTFSVMVKASTLTDVLLEAQAPACPDLFVLDVEGFEDTVLDGLDFSKYKPRFILIENNDDGAISTLIKNKYVLVEKLSERDYLFRAEKD